MTKRYVPMIVGAEAAVMLAGSVGVAIIAAAPSTADPIYDLCMKAPPEDLCHVIWNVPVDPSIPHYPARQSNSTPQGPDDTACIASPTGPCAVSYTHLDEARFLIIGPSVTSNAAGGKPAWSNTTEANRDPN